MRSFLLLDTSQRPQQLMVSTCEHVAESQDSCREEQNIVTTCHALLPPLIINTFILMHGIGGSLLSAQRDAQWC